ncbi:MAG: PilZ domain [Planctomycetota bacterium]
MNLRAPLAVRWSGDSESSKIRILDLSRSGFRFECHKIYSLHDHGHAESIKPEGTHIGSDFVIVWAREVKPGTYQYGARFVKSETLRRSA